MNSIEISVVVPIYGCRNCLSQLVERLSSALSPIGAYEILLIDDCSPDGAWVEILQLAKGKPFVRGMRLSRNFGQHAAIAAGVSASLGQWVAVMDGDLEHPPELLPELYARGRAGCEVVLTHARNPARVTGRNLIVTGRNLIRTAFYGALRLLGDTPLHEINSTFSLMSRRVVDAYLTVRDPDRRHVLLLHWLGFRHVVVEYDRAPRHSGRSAYNLDRLLDSAIQAMIFHATKIFRFVICAGAALFAAGACLVCLLITLLILTGHSTAWLALVTIGLSVGGVNLMSLGFVGLYTERVMNHVRARPTYVVAETTDAAPKADV